MSVAIVKISILFVACLLIVLHFLYFLSSPLILVHCTHKPTRLLRSPQHGVASAAADSLLRQSTAPPIYKSTDAEESSSLLVWSTCTPRTHTVEFGQILLVFSACAGVRATCVRSFSDTPPRQFPLVVMHVQYCECIFCCVSN